MNPPPADETIRVLKARWVFPVVSRPLADAYVVIRGQRIEAVRSRPPVDNVDDVDDLGNVAILPGLVNAHTHLEFSDLRRPLGRPGVDITTWIRHVIDNRRQSTEPLAARVERGLRESTAAGTTTLGEIAQPDWPVELFAQAPLDTTVFMELIAPKPERIEAALCLAAEHLGLVAQRIEPADEPHWRGGLAPHAPYSVCPAMLAAAIKLSRDHRLALAFHLAESRQELELTQSGSGPFRRLLEELGAWSPEAFSHPVQPQAFLRQLAEAHRALVIHGAFLNLDEMRFLADHAQRMAVVYCPRTQAWFDHGAYDLAALLRLGVSVAIGTDSRASSPDLSVLEEMRFIRRSHSEEVESHQIVHLGTLGGARALGCEDRVGSLQAGKYANLAIVALPDRDDADPYELLLGGREPVVATWYRGRKIV